MGKTLSVTAALLVGVALGCLLPSTQAQGSGERTVWYFYRVQWGKQAEFVEL